MASDLKHRNRRLATASFLTAAGMVGAAYAAVPLYEIFCQVTGYGGTTQIAEVAPERLLDRRIIVRFNADADRKLPWRFAPAQDKVDLKIGEHGLAFYRAKNLSPDTIVGTASFNVTPAKAGQYFNKISCFCFTEQKLEAGREVDMPVSFFVDPAIADDPNLDDVRTITLSYTFFRMDSEPERTARADKVSTNNEG
ncbi:MAG: cytochrome c oxidase assembly protein [Pseudomonadota bacterium]|jgi:cytochrome c oxidase assembly protein subunit 11|nr:cytochrome c oxidase assembly protein [Pseudomonadota bacterium]